MRGGGEGEGKSLLTEIYRTFRLRGRKIYVKKKEKEKASGGKLSSS